MKKIITKITSVMLVATMIIGISIPVNVQAQEFASRDNPYAFEQFSIENAFEVHPGVVQSRIDGTFSVHNVGTHLFRHVVDRNNIFTADVHIEPRAFGGNVNGLITSVDIIVTWPGGFGGTPGTRTFSNVRLNETVTARVPAAGGRYSILVRANGFDGVMGTDTLRIWDTWGNT